MLLIGSAIVALLFAAYNDVRARLHKNEQCLRAVPYIDDVD